MERGENGDLDIGDLDVIIGRDFVITVEEHTGPELGKLLDQVRGAIEILGGQGMADGVGWQIVLLVPFTRSPMEI